MCDMDLWEQSVSFVVVSRRVGSVDIDGRGNASK